MSDSSEAQAGFFSQFGASMKKNFQQKKNKPCGCIVETLLPILFVIGLIFIWLATNPTDHDGRDFTNYTYMAEMMPTRFPSRIMPGIACTKPESQMHDSPGVQLPKCDDMTEAARHFKNKVNSSDPALSVSVAASLRNFELMAESNPRFQLYEDLKCYNTADNMITVDGLCFIADPSNVLAGFAYNFDAPRLIPTMDDLILAKWAAMAKYPARPIRGASRTDMGAVRQSGYLYFSPNTEPVRKLVQHINDTSVYFKFVFKGIFETQKDIEHQVTDSSEGSTEGMNWAGVHVEQMDSLNLDFKVRVNRTTVARNGENLAVLYSGGITDRTKWYLLGGFMTLQQQVTEFYMKEFKNVTLPPEPLQNFMGYVDWEQKVFLQIAGGLAPLMLVLSFLYPVSQLVKVIVLEKETGIREAMMIMSLGTGSFYISWFATYAIQFFITSVICTFLLAVTFVPQSSPVIVFFAFYLFCLSTIALAAMLASLFSKARLASLMSPVIFFILAMPLFAMDNAPRGVQWLLQFLSPSAFATCLQLIFNYEQATGMGNKELSNPNDPVPMIGAMFMLGIDTVIYILLTLYFDAVFPSDWGTKRHPLFCIVEPFRWLKRKSGDNDEDADIPMDSRDPNGVFEDEDVSASANPVSVRIKGLRKQFTRGAETFLAVNNMHLNLRENEVNVLLGHNGAGKSTTMNMMTGMIEIDQGDCTVYGKSVKRDISAVHKMVGYCPQRNILWPELTCYQHLDFFATIKGVPAEQRDEEIHKMLKAVDLGDKIDYASGALSGGQKRKLSVAIAFIGNSKLVFLDEPTAGMDVAARRHTWDVIKQMTPGRTILLTTHFMDEADLLGHTISIMSKGMLKCSGSSVFLKSRLGVGYSLNMSVDPTVDHTELCTTVANQVDDAQQLPCGAGELAFRLPVNATSAFPRLLETLENSGPAMGCKGFGVTVTTLEEVFLKIADDEEMEAQVGDSAATGATRKNNSGSHSPTSAGSPKLTSPTSNGSATIEVDPRQEELWKVQSTQREVSTIVLMKTQFMANLMKRFHNARRDRRTQCLQIIVPVVCVCLAMLLTLLVFVQVPSQEIAPEMYDKYGIDEQDFDTANCENFLNVSNWHPSLIHTARNFSNGEAMADWYVETYKNHGNPRFNGMFCNDQDLSAITKKPSTLLFHNTTGYHAMADVTNQYYRNYIRSVANDKTEVKLTVQPWPLTDREDAVFSSIRTILISIIITIPFTFIPSTFVSWIVKEYETHAKHLQTSSGLNFYVYWLSNLTFDLISFTFTELLVILVFLIFNREEYIGNGENFGATFLLFMFYGLASIASSYLVSFAFDEHAQAQNIVMLSNFIAGFLLVLVIFILEDIGGTTKDVAVVFKYIFRFIPSYCLGEGIINMATADLVKAFGTDQNRFDMDVTGWPILYMALEFPVFMIATFLIDHPSRRMKQQRLLHDPDAIPDKIANEDPDVAAERAIVENGEDLSRATDLVTVKNLSKIYGSGKKAVKNLSFGVKTGEVFGFLGTNGAGKTTTISILCGEHMPTTGHATVVGYDVVDDALKAQRNIGYCPQFDATLDLLTVKEHLELYSAIRGLDAYAIGVVVPGLMEVCGLSTYKDVVASALSGGNRRKLSVAISLIGGPRVVFLDEPSAGMDPMARRGMWEVIDHISTQCAVVLTTHHLEEVEALAHRVAIMVDGQLMCIGDKTHLKNKFGSGFEMVVRLEDESKVTSFEHFIMSNMSNAVLNEKRGTKYTFALPTDTKLSEAFQQVESVKKECGIADYCISQTSLEQVFLRISEAAEVKKDTAPDEGDVEDESAPVSPLTLSASQTNRRQA